MSFEKISPGNWRPPIGDAMAEVRKPRRSAIYSVENNISISNGTERLIFDRGKVNATNANNSLKHPDTRKHTVLRITVVKHGRNQSGETPQVLSVTNDFKQGNMRETGANARSKSLDIMKGANVPISASKFLSMGVLQMKAVKTYHNKKRLLIYQLKTRISSKVKQIRRCYWRRS